MIANRCAGSRPPYAAEGAVRYPAEASSDALAILRRPFGTMDPLDRRGSGARLMGWPRNESPRTFSREENLRFSRASRTRPVSGGRWTAIGRWLTGRGRERRGRFLRTGGFPSEAHAPDNACMAGGASAAGGGGRHRAADSPWQGGDVSARPGRRPLNPTSEGRHDLAGQGRGHGVGCHGLPAESPARGSAGGV